MSWHPTLTVSVSDRRKRISDWLFRLSWNGRVQEEDWVPWIVVGDNDIVEGMCCQMWSGWPASKEEGGGGVVVLHRVDEEYQWMPMRILARLCDHCSDAAWLVWRRRRHLHHSSLMERRHVVAVAAVVGGDPCVDVP